MTLSLVPRYPKVLCAPHPHHSPNCPRSLLVSCWSHFPRDSASPSQSESKAQGPTYPHPRVLILPTHPLEVQFPSNTPLPQDLKPLSLIA